LSLLRELRLPKPIVSIAGEEAEPIKNLLSGNEVHYYQLLPDTEKKSHNFRFVHPNGFRFSGANFTG
jgi:hypothetical protein